MAPDAYLPYVSRVPLSWTDEGPGPAAHWLEGTLLFVDVAGFTALSERLSTRGRAGAEELTDLLDAAFARLLAAAYEDGGSLLSFGGDALLLFFHGPDHARRCAHAAAVIKRKPAELGALPTSVGDVRLRLSMGAHTGRFCFLSTGADSRLVLLLGEDATRTVRLEQRAVAGQVLVSDALAAQLPEACSALGDGAALLTRVPRRALLAAHAPDEVRTAPERYLAPLLRQHIAARASSEHRRVAVGFVQLRGTDRLLATEPLAALEAVHEVVVTAQQAAADHGVCLLASDIDADGAKLILVAGAPRATEHEEERLLRTCRTVLDLDVPLQLRGGVTAGHVFVGDVGPPYRRAFTVMGDRVNLAARLMASAAPGQLRTTPQVLASSATSFVTTDLEPLLLKGIREPVPAVAVGAPIGQEVVRAQTDLFGRDDELALLTGALERAAQGNGGCVEVVGEAGVGKSALVGALVSRTGTPSLRVAAAPYEATTPFGLVKRVLRSVLGVDTEADARETGRRIGTSLSGLGAVDLALVLVAADGVLDGEGPVGGPPVQDDLFAQRLARAVRRTLEVLVPDHALLVVEDVQWADPSSLALLRSIADKLSATPWLLVSTRRPSATAPAPAMLGRGEVVWLSPLQPEAATDLVHHLTSSTPMTPHRVATLVARSGGNPMFLTELVRSGSDLEELPDSIEAVVHARLDALPTYLRELVRKASVLGTVFDLDLLGEVAGFRPDREEWRMLDGVLERQGSRGVFTSQMYCEVAYSALLYRERRRLHREAGRALAARSSSDVELLALHAAKAEDDELTWRFAVQAGRRAWERGAYDEAVQDFRRAIAAHQRSGLGPAQETGTAYRLLGEVLVAEGSPAEAQVAYRRARELSPRGLHGDPELLHLEGQARLHQGRHGSASRWFRLAGKAWTPQDGEALRHAIDLSYAGNALRQGRYRTAVRVLQKVIGEAIEGSEQWAQAHYTLHLAFITLGDPRKAQHRTQSLPVYEHLGNLARQAAILNNLGMDAYYDGRWTEAVTYFERSRACEEADANDVGAAVSEMNAAEVLADQGTFEEAHRLLSRALRTFLASGYTTGTAIVFAFLGRLETRRGDWDAAERHLLAARDAVADMGADSLLPDVVVRQAELALVRGQGDLARTLLDELDALPDIGSEMRTTALRFRAALHARDGLDDLAVQCLREAVASGKTGSFSEALARHSLAVVLARRHDPEADTHRHAALETLRRLGVHRFRDPLAGDDLVVIGLPPAVVDLAQRRPEHEAAAV